MTDLANATAPMTVAERDRAVVSKLRTTAAFALVGLAICAFVLGAPALIAAGQAWIGLPGWLAYMVPITIDLGTVLTMVGTMAAKPRSTDAHEW